MLIFIQRGTSVPFFLRFFRGAAESPHVTLSEGEISRCVRSCFVHFFLFAATKKKETQPKKEKTLPKRNRVNDFCQ